MPCLVGVAHFFFFFGGGIVFGLFACLFRFDIFTVNQFEAATYPQDFWTTTFKEQVRDIGHTLLILHPWDRPIPLMRAWCVWEMYCTLDTGAKMVMWQVDKDAKKLEKSLATDPQTTIGIIDDMLVGNVHALFLRAPTQNKKKNEK